MRKIVFTIAVLSAATGSAFAQEKVNSQLPDKQENDTLKKNPSERQRNVIQMEEVNIITNGSSSSERKSVVKPETVPMVTKNQQVETGSRTKTEQPIK